MPVKRGTEPYRMVLAAYSEKVTFTHTEQHHTHDLWYGIYSPKTLLVHYYFSYAVLDLPGSIDGSAFA